MGAKNSSSKCTTTAIDYVRRKDLNKLTRQLSKGSTSFRYKKNTKEGEQNDIQLLQLDVDHDEQQRSALHFAAIESLLMVKKNINSIFIYGYIYI